MHYFSGGGTLLADGPASFSRCVVPRLYRRGRINPFDLSDSCVGQAHLLVHR